MAGHSFADFIRKWELLNATLKQQLPNMPHLAQEQADFEAFINEAKSLDELQKQLRGKLQDITKQRQAAQFKGIDLNERLAVQLKGILGPRNQNLVGFGVRPRKVPKRRKGEGADTPPPSPPPPQPPPVEVQSKGIVVPHAPEVTPSVAAAE